MSMKRILTSLDIHLDTRLGTANRIDPKISERLISNPDYWIRENDCWFLLSGGLVTDVEFKEAYAERGGVNTKATLTGSVRTGITPFLMRILADDHINRLNQMGDPESEVALTVNYWPYDLDSEELEWLRDIFHELYGLSIPVEFVTIPMKELTPALLNANFAACVIYEFPEWIRHHHDDLRKVQLNCFNFIAPKIFEEDVSELPIDQKQAALSAFRLMNLVHMDFEFIDAKYFSVINVHGK